MGPQALVFTALCVLCARAATIPEAQPALDKKLPEIETPEKDIITDNVSSEQELIDPINGVKEIENNLRNQGAENIPVKIVVDESASSNQALKKADQENEVISESNLDEKPQEADVKNPGEPQRQEHETQNPESQNVIDTLRQTILDTQAVFNSNVQRLSQGIQEYLENNEQLAVIQQSVQNLQKGFTNHISKMNVTLQAFLKPNEGLTSTSEEVNEVANTQTVIENVGSRLKILDEKFRNGVTTLNEGVHVLQSLKADGDGAPITTNPQKPSIPAALNPMIQYLQQFQNTIVQGFNNITSAVQNYVNQNQQNAGNVTASAPGGFLQGLGVGIQNIFQQTSASPASAQSDEQITSRPTLWQGFQSSIQNILNPAQAGQAGQNSPIGPPSSPGPLVQAIQNNPLVQGVVSLIQPNRQPQNPSADTPAQPASQEGGNIVPKPESEVQQPDSLTNNQPGPIKNMMQKNPIVQGIAGAVQKIQNNIYNPERPRDQVDDQKQEIALKGHGSGSGGEHNIDNSGVASEIVEKEVVCNTDSIAKPQKPEETE